jgi:hypothetical protein
MKTAHFRQKVAASLAVACAFFGASRAPAGTEIEAAPDKKTVEPLAKPVQVGMLTFGGQSSRDFSTGFVDGILPVWNPGNFYFFLDTRTTYNSEDQMLGSYGVATRYLVPDHEMILGLNAFYDRIHGKAGSDFDELGLGAEVLTHWVDARFNYYLPEAEQYEVSSHSETFTDTTLGPVFQNVVSPRVRLLQQQRFTKTKTTKVRTYEAALEGWNAEVGFLVPGLDKYLELRAYVGAYHYNNPFGRDFTGVKARVEARPLPGVIANVEYWEDAYPMGGHWTGELAVSVPFSIYNLAAGRNPFDGWLDSFRPRQRQFDDRLSDMIVRSHRDMTITGSHTNSSTSSNTATATEGVIVTKPPVTPPARGTPPPPQVGQGEE